MSKTRSADKRSIVSRAIALVRRLHSSVCKSPYSNLIPCFLIPAGIMLLIHILRGIYPFGNETVLVLDLNAQYVYFYEALRDVVWGDNSLLYSFSRALGGEFLGMYAYYLASPLSWLVVLFPDGCIQEALLLIFLLKTGLCGLTFGWYLHKTSRHVNKIYVRIFATLYALSSYAVVQQHNSMWIDALIWLPVVTYAIEQLICHRQYKLFVISLAITVMSNYYIGYMVCIYVALYFFYYLAAHADSNPCGESHHFWRALGRIVGASALALGIAAVMILGAYYSLTFGKNEFSTPNFSFSLRFSLAEFLVKLLPGAYDSVRPSGLPILYCGTLTLLLLPFYYLRKDISMREKLMSTLFAAIFPISFIINPIDLIWHGFQKPNWLNYRYSFMLCFILLVLAYKAMVGIRRQKAGNVLTIGTVLIFAVIILEQFEYKSFVLDEFGLVEGKIPTLRTVWFTIIAVISLCAALSMVIHAKGRGALRKWSAVLLAVVCAETFINGMIQTTSLDIDVAFSTHSSYNNYVNSAREIADLVAQKDTSFYRAEKTRMRKNNDNMALDLRGLSSSTSTLNEETLRFLEGMGYTSYSHRAKYYGETPLNDSLLGVKYVLSEKKVSESRSDYNEVRTLHAMMKDLYTVFAETDDYVAFQNPYALSLAYAVDDAVKDFIFYTRDEDGDAVYAEASIFDRLNGLVTAMMGAEETVEVFVPVATEYFKDVNCNIGYAEDHKKYTPTNSSADAYLTFSSPMPKDGYLFFYAPSDYPRETEITVNDLDFGDFMGTDSERIKLLGYFEEGTPVDVRLTLTDSNFYLHTNENVFYYLNVDLLEQVTNTLASEQYEIERFTDTHFEGTIRTSDPGEMILTTIPHDEGWKVYVDGKRVDTFKAIDALVAFEIDSAGSHTLELVYSPRIITVGAVISAVSAVAFAGLVLLENRQKKRKSNAPSTKQ